MFNKNFLLLLLLCILYYSCSNKPPQTNPVIQKTNIPQTEKEIISIEDFGTSVRNDEQKPIHQTNKKGKNDKGHWTLIASHYPHYDAQDSLLKRVNFDLINAFINKQWVFDNFCKFRLYMK